jgi:hypothetical protein
MRVTKESRLVEVKSASAKVSDDGLSALILVSSQTADYQLALSRSLFDKLALQITREQARVRKPARRLSSDREPT